MSDPDEIQAVHEGDHGRLAKVIASGADLNAFQLEGINDGKTALMIAVEVGNIAATELLIVNGANLDAQGVSTILLL
jgi:hypothetical protein